MQEAPEQADWLTPAEKSSIAGALSVESARKEEVGSLSKVFLSGHVWLLTAIYFSFLMGYVVPLFWMPQMVKDSGIADPLYVGLLCSIPNIGAIAFVLLIGRIVDRSNDPRILIAGSLALATIGLALAVSLKGPVLVVGSLTLSYAGFTAGLATFWLLPTATLGGFTAVAGIPIVCAFGSLAGFISPSFVGWLNTVTHRTDYSAYVMCAFVVLSAGMVFLVPKNMVARHVDSGRRDHPASAALDEPLGSIVG
jgi:nitrate/nitrite transporter NarK